MLPALLTIKAVWCRWLHLFLRETLEGGAAWVGQVVLWAAYRLKRLTYYATGTHDTSGGADAFEAASHSRQLLRKGCLQLRKYAISTCERLLCVLVLNVLWWLYCSIYWDMDLGNAFELYGWGFVKDVLGTCAASGWGPVWGIDCI
jgi:hypothetical protein